VQKLEGDETQMKTLVERVLMKLKDEEEFKLLLGDAPSIDSANKNLHDE